jgi:hypothetical protein
VRAAFAEDPALEAFFMRGRVSIAAARVLRNVSEEAVAAEEAAFAGAQPNVATTGV